MTNIAIKIDTLKCRTGYTAAGLPALVFTAEAYVDGGEQPVIWTRAMDAEELAEWEAEGRLIGAVVPIEAGMEHGDVQAQRLVPVGVGTDIPEPGA